MSSTSLAPVRRRRGLILGGLVLALVFILYVPWGLPASVKDRGISTLSRANVVQLTKEAKIDEIYGLLHLVISTGDNGKVLNEQPELDVSNAIGLDVYAAGAAQVNWSKEMARLNAVHPIVVFSKGTYNSFTELPLLSSYSRRAKQLLESYNITPPPKVIEVDLREDGHHIKGLLGRLTKISTFPNVVIQGKSVGGSDNLQTLHQTGDLRKLIKAAGAKYKRSPREKPVHG